jgi:peptidoglycan-associated lipoprotein
LRHDCDHDFVGDGPGPAPRLTLDRDERYSHPATERITVDRVIRREAGHGPAGVSVNQAPSMGTDPMNTKLLGALAAVALLAACSNNADTTAATGSGATAATSGPAPGSEEDLVANVGDRVFYGFNQSTLSGDARGTLDRQAQWLGRYPQVSVQVAGNCDERGTEEYNLALGQRRANAARDYLVARGVSSSRITTISYGKDRPTASGSDEQAWAQNRNAITSVR